MAKQSVSSLVDTYWVDSKTKINNNFTELYSLAYDGVRYSVTTAATPASGTCAVQFTFKDKSGTTLAVPTSGFAYIATAADGLTSASVTSIAALTNGRVLNIPTVTSLFQYTTTAAGLLGITLTASAGSYYVIFVQPNGKILASTVCTVNS